jgi:multicomponent Na+:H+ antiporter subunit G
VSADRVLDVVHLGLIWLLVLLASATSAHLIARRALHRGEKPWTRPDR